MIFTNPQPRNYEHDVETRGTLQRHFEPERLQGARQSARFQLAILSDASPGRRLLDFGADAGVLVDEAIKQGWDATGLDLNRGLVEAANRHWGFDAMESRSLAEFVETKPLPLDAIVSNQVFEHLLHPVEAGRLLMSMLRPGGVLYIDVPNADQLGERLSRGKTLDPTGTFNHFTRSSLKDLARRIECRTIWCSGAPSLVGVYSRMGLRQLCCPLGRISKRLLPSVGTGVSLLGCRS